MDSLPEYDFLIVGSGIFGSVFAFEAGRAGKKCLVVEKRGRIGGSLYCENIRGIEVHRFGIHVFRTDDRELWEYMNRFGEFFPSGLDSRGKKYEGVPLHGYTRILGEMLENADVFLNTDYEQIRRKARKMAGRVVYTGRLDTFYRECYGRLLYERARFETRTLYREYYQTRVQENPAGSECQIIEHKRLTGTQSPLTVITVRSRGKGGEEEELVRPLETKENRELFEKYRLLAEHENHICFGGRMYHWGFYSIEEAVRDARLLAKRLL
ncbi:MAG: NAD(P)-binding protein [Clostridiales bacterium]|nr:NAD(P)-binding protein [Clostridiales bacterium]